MSSTTSDDADRKPTPGSRMKMLLTAAGVAVFAVVGVILMLQFAASEREMRQWQSRMSIVIDSRFADIDRWIGRQLDDLRGIADNASVQLYLTVFHEAGVGADEAQAELGYLGNLLEVVAVRAGFRSEDTGPQADANIERAGVAGLALIDLENFIIVSSSGFPPLQGPVRVFLEEAERGVSSVSDMFLNDRGQPSMAFLVPVYDVQDDETADSQLGYVVGVKEVGAELFPLLNQPGAAEQTAETLIVRQDGNKIEYLTPRVDGTESLKKSLAADTPALAAAWAIRTAGGFAIQTDYAGNEVLASSRSFNLVPWTLLYKINTAEALQESEDRLQLMMIVFGVIIVLVLIGMLALWYYGTRSGPAKPPPSSKRWPIDFRASAISCT